MSIWRLLVRFAIFSIDRSNCGVCKAENLDSCCGYEFNGGFEMSMVYGGLVWPAYCPWHGIYDYDYTYSYAAPQSPHLDVEHGPYVGQHWYGKHIYENCMYCAQPLMATTDPRVNYCPSCGRSQWHRL